MSASENGPERIRVIVRPGKDDWIGVAYSSAVERNDIIREYVRPQFSDEGALLTTLRAAANYICRAKSDYYPADVRDTLIKALTYHIVRLAATSDV